MADCNTFRKELAIRYPTYGHALWEPDPGKEGIPVDVGDVGVIREGTFHRLFNAILPENSSNFRPGSSFPPRLKPKSSNDDSESKSDDRTFFHSRDVNKESHARQSSKPGFDDKLVNFSCSDNQGGALLYLPFSARRKDTIARGDFIRWMVCNIDHCMRLADEVGFGDTHTEDIILVTGCHLARSWVNVTFSKDREDAYITLGVRRSGNSEVYFGEGDVDGGDVKFGPQGQNLTNNQCIFVRGYRVFRVSDSQLDRKARANPPDKRETGANEPRRPEYTDDTNGAKDQDPLHVLLAYIVENAADCTLALLHDDDLQCIKGAKTLQAGMLMEFLRQKAPRIYKPQCELLWGGSGARTSVTIATLSEKVCEALHTRAAQVQDNVRTGEPSSRIPLEDYSNYYPPFRPERTRTQTTQPSPRGSDTLPDATAVRPITNPPSTDTIPLEHPSGVSAEQEPSETQSESSCWSCCWSC